MIRETNTKPGDQPTVLGLDIGAKSIGWALVRGPRDRGAGYCWDGGASL